MVDGSFWITNFAPDGDSVRFKAGASFSWPTIEGKRPRLNASGQVQLRFCGIDAPETHFSGYEQTFGVESREDMLKNLGFRRIRWSRGRVQSCERDGIEGCIAFKEYGSFKRPIALVFKVSSDQVDTSQDGWMEKSLNYGMIKTGYAYPSFYTEEIQNAFQQAAHDAHSNNSGLWRFDLTMWGVDALFPNDGGTCFPKLFRRIVRHRRTDDADMLRDRLRRETLRSGGTFADVVGIQEDDHGSVEYIWMTRFPWELVWQ